jgi:hypothetical protein
MGMRRQGPERTTMANDDLTRQVREALMVRAHELLLEERELPFTPVAATLIHDLAPDVARGLEAMKKWIPMPRYQEAAIDDALAALDGTNADPLARIRELAIQIQHANAFESAKLAQEILTCVRQLPRKGNTAHETS